MPIRKLQMDGSYDRPSQNGCFPLVSSSKRPDDPIVSLHRPKMDTKTGNKSDGGLEKSSDNL